jgi:hypothetical protein
LPIRFIVGTHPILSHLHGSGELAQLPRAMTGHSRNMATLDVRIDNLRQLESYVYETLCEHNLLQRGAYPMTQRMLQRQGRPCGVYFCLHGPRATKFTAIWDRDTNSVLFYGCDGERFLKVQVDEIAELEPAVA